MSALGGFGLFAPPPWNDCYLHGGRGPAIGRKSDGHHGAVMIRPSLPIGCDEEHELSGLCRASHRMPPKALGRGRRRSTRSFLLGSLA
jgi:hypothetical protein